MKRMVKNGDLIDVEPDGTITVAGKPIGGEENEREITLTMPYASNSPGNTIKISYIEKEIYDKINEFYYDTIKVYYNDGNPIGVFHVTRFNHWATDLYGSKYYACIGYENANGPESTWYGKSVRYTFFMAIKTHYSTSNDSYYFDIIRAPEDTNNLKRAIDIDKSKFDDLYKLADKPTQDGTYVLKATVSGGAVTYTWVAQ